ncbi:MAG: DsbA family protein [Acidobacteriota bacterium]|nr:DsbA family protein [Acidobacteriota bacterium]
MSRTRTAIAMGLLLLCLGPIRPPSLAEERGGAPPLATLGDVVISEAEVRAAAQAELEALELKTARAQATHARRRHEILEEALERLLEERLLAAEAGRQGIAVEALLAKELPPAEFEPTAEEIEDFYRDNEERITVSREAALPLVARHLRTERENRARAKLLKRLEGEHRVKRSLPPLRFELQSSDHPALGPADAPVVLTLFSDFACPYCRQYGETLRKIAAHYDRQVRLVFRQFPLRNLHPNAERAAEASLCAADQNRFWEMHDLLFAAPDGLGEEAIRAMAASLELDGAAFGSCLGSGRHRDRVRKDIREGSTAGVDGTPTLFVNGRYFGGVRSFDEVTAIIDEELAPGE